MFNLEFPGVQGKTKTIPGGFFQKKVCPQPPSSTPCLFFSSGIAHSKTIDLKWSYEALASFSCVLSLLSVLERFTHLFCEGEGGTHMGSKAPPPPPLTLLPHSQYIFAVNILPKAGENPQPYSILQTVLK